MKEVIRVVVGVLSLLCVCHVEAQDNGSYYKTYSKGNLKEKFIIEDSVIYYSKYYKSGILKDTSFSINNLYAGLRKGFYKDGSLKYKYDYGVVPEPFTFNYKRYFKNGALLSEGAYKKKKPFGVSKRFNKKGETISYSDNNKDRIVKVHHKFRKQRHIESLDALYSATNLKLSNGENEVIIKVGALIDWKIKNETQIARHLQIEGYSKDSILISDFSYDLSKNKKTLKFDSLFSVAIDDIEEIYFSFNHANRKQFGAFITTLIGTELILIPIILTPLFGLSTLVSPISIGYFIAGPPLIIWGRHLSKKLVPKKYNLEEWRYSVQSD